MTIPFKPRVAKTICRIDRKTQAVTANVAFEDIDLTIDGEGSEVYDYGFIFILHSIGSSIALRLNNLNSYSRDLMRGYDSNAGAVSGSANRCVFCNTSDQTYPSIAQGKITGYVGNKRHINILDGKYNFAGTNQTEVSNSSFYTSDTSSEISSAQFLGSTSQTITYSLIITAVPKLQYNPHAIRLPRVEWSSQSDTRNISGFSGEDYKLFLDCHLDSAETDFIDVRANSVATSTRTRQQMQNASGSLSSGNTTQSRDARLHTGTCLIDKQIGRKLIATTTNNFTGSPQQTEQYTTETDTSTEFTNCDLVPSGTVSGYVDPYLVPHGYNADLTPWTFRQEVDINGDFSAGHSFDIPPWAIFMKVDFVGKTENSLSKFNIEFNNSVFSLDRQYLYSTSSSTSSLFDSDRSIGLTQQESVFSGVISLKGGANRPLISKSFLQNQILIQGSWIKDSSTVFTSTQIKADNTNTINGKLTISFI